MADKREIALFNLLIAEWHQLCDRWTADSTVARAIAAYRIRKEADYWHGLMTAPAEYFSPYPQWTRGGVTYSWCPVENRVVYVSGDVEND